MTETFIRFEKAFDMIGEGKIQDSKSIAGLYPASNWLKPNTLRIGK